MIPKRRCSLKLSNHTEGKFEMKTTYLRNTALVQRTSLAALVLFAASWCTHSFGRGENCGREESRIRRDPQTMCHIPTKDACFRLYHGRMNHIRVIVLPQNREEHTRLLAELTQTQDTLGRLRIASAPQSGQVQSESRVLESHRNYLSGVEGSLGHLTLARTLFSTLRVQNPEGLQFLVMDVKEHLASTLEELESRFRTINQFLERHPEWNDPTLIIARNVYRDLLNSVRAQSQGQGLRLSLLDPTTPEAQRALEPMGPELRAIILTLHRMNERRSSTLELYNELQRALAALEVEMRQHITDLTRERDASQERLNQLTQALQQQNAAIAEKEQLFLSLQERIQALQRDFGHWESVLRAEEIRWHCCDNVPFCNTLPRGGSADETHYQAFEQAVAAQPERHHGCIVGGDPEYR